MKSQFDFYDFVAYLIPGLLTLGILLWIPASYLDVDFRLDGSDVISSASVALVILAASYALGHLVQAIGSDLETWFDIRKTKRHDNTRISEKLLPEMNRDQIVQNLEAVLHLEIPTDADNIPEQTKELRRLAHSLVYQEGVARRVDILGGLYRLHRGTFVAVLLSILIGSHEAIRHLMCSAYPNLFSGSSYHCGEPSHLVTSLVALPILFAVASRVQRRIIRYFDHFEATAFREFFVWRQRTLVHRELAASTHSSMSLGGELESFDTSTTAMPLKPQQPFGPIPPASHAQAGDDFLETFDTDAA